MVTVLFNNRIALRSSSTSADTLPSDFANFQQQQHRDAAPIKCGEHIVRFSLLVSMSQVIA
jgi:hypothetical protein